MSIKSMTGYGKGICEKDGLRVVIEIKTVNHRFLDLTIKLPKIFNFAEDTIRKEIKKNFARGHFDILISYEDKRETRKQITYDSSIANAYLESAQQMHKDLFVENNLGAYQLLILPDVIKISNEEDDESFLESVLKDALNDSITKLDAMRTKEGLLMEQDFIDKLSTISDIVSKIETLAPNMVKEHFEKVRQRISEMLQDVAVDEARMLNEVAFYSDKVCVDEEIQRLKTHIDHFGQIIKNGGNVGKQLDFIVQEMNREANTCGSKCNNIEISSLVISLKNEIEKVREQIQNIE